MKGHFLFIPLLFFISFCGVADLRNDTLKTEPISETIQIQAKNILNDPLDPFLQPSLWKDVKALEIFMVDYWNSGFVRFFTPVPERVQAMKVLIYLDENSIEVKFTDGKQRGKIIGVEKGEPFTYDSKSGRVYNKDSEIQTYVESLRLYLLLPFQVHKYKNLAFLGEMSLGSSEYQELFATNGGWELSDSVDQYRLYIRKDSGKIEFIQFTYRDVFPFYKGILQYDDYTKLDGKLFPMKVAIKDEFGDEQFVHQLQLGTIKFHKDLPRWED